MIAEYVRISLSVGELCGIVVVSFLAGLLLGNWLAR